MDSYGEKKFLDRKYFSNLRIEKLDAETGEPILHDDAVFGVYRAERNEAEDGDGEVKYYTADTMILGSRYFLEAMRAKEIRPFARRKWENFFMERFRKEHRSVRKRIW